MDRYGTDWYPELEDPRTPEEIRTDNAHALYSLTSLGCSVPFIKHTIALGCVSRREYVAFSLYLSETVKRLLIRQALNVVGASISSKDLEQRLSNS
jgi:hypothetical protein